MDSAIRKLTISERAEAAARRTAATGEIESNPFEGTADERDWAASYDRFVREFTAPEGSEAGA